MGKSGQDQGSDWTDRERRTVIWLLNKGWQVNAMHIIFTNDYHSPIQWLEPITHIIPETALGALLLVLGTSYHPATLLPDLLPVGTPPRRGFMTMVQSGARTCSY